MDSEKPSAQIKEKDLFNAAESGDASLFKSLPEEQLLKFLSLRNEDARSLLHVAVSSGQTEVLQLPLPHQYQQNNGIKRFFKGFRTSFGETLYCIYNVKIIYSVYIY